MKLRNVLLTALVCPAIGTAHGCKPKNGERPTPSQTTARAAVPDVPASPLGSTRSQFYVPLPDGLLERPIELVDGAGNYHQKVTTESEKAQKYYDQGQVFLAGYDWVNAARSFHETLRLDSSVAMAWAGLALADHGVGRPNEATRALNEAIARVNDGKATESERAWVVAIRAKFAAMRVPLDEQPAAHGQYKKAVDALIQIDRSDPHAWVFRGMTEEPGPWGRGQNGGRAAAEYYRKALSLDPADVAALHYQAHTLENLGRHQEAAQLAEKFAERVPVVPHAQHMYAHTLPRLGKWEEARKTLVRANELHRAFFAEEKVPPNADWHFGHNLMVLGVVELRLGNQKKAEALFKEAYDLDYAGFYEAIYDAPYLTYLLWAEKYDEALAAARETEKDEQSSFARLVAASVAGEVYVARGDLDAARRAQARVEKHYKVFQKEMADEPFAMFTPYATHEYRTVLPAKIAIAEGDENGRLELLELGDGISQAQTIDAWATGLYLLDRLRKFAAETGDEDLAASMARRIEVIDPDFPGLK